jgi:hypothetical protein
MSLLSHTRLAGKPQFSRYVGRSSRGCRYSASCEKQQVPMTVTRSIAILAVATAAAVPLLGGCAGSDSNQADSAQQQQDSPGPGKSGERWKISSARAIPAICRSSRSRKFAAPS